MTTYEHRVSERTLLVPGKVFKAREGPLIRMKDGLVESFADKGPFIFISKEQNDDVVLIHAYDRNGFHSVLHIEGDRTPGVDQIIPRPYVISQTVRKVKLCRTLSKSKAVEESHRKTVAKAGKRGRKASKKSRTTSAPTKKKRKP